MVVQEKGRTVFTEKKIVSAITLTLLLTSLLTLVFKIPLVKGNPMTIYVDDDNITGPWEGTMEHPYRNISNGIEHASFGDTIFIYNGTYYEQVVVNKTVSLVGENINTTIIDGSMNAPYGYPLVFVTADNVTISGLTMQNCSGPSHDIINVAGIMIAWSRGCVVQDNLIMNNDVGIFLPGESWEDHGEHTIQRNTIRNNYIGGISAFSSNNVIQENTVADNVLGGIELYQSENNTVRKNIILRNRNGIVLSESPENRLRDNVMWGNKYNLGVAGQSISHWVQDIDTSNLVDGKKKFII
jgi:parallel beta-helix repeat protein